MIQLETERLILRAFTFDDATDMFQYAKDDRVGPMAGWAPHVSIEETKEVIQLFLGEQDVWAIVPKDTGRVIGSIGLHDRRPDPDVQHDAQREIGYVLSPEYWGNGLVPEAVREVQRYGFEQLKLERIWCGYYSYNTQSRRVVEKSGFTYAFTKQQQLTRLDGRTVDFLVYVLRREEWEQTDS